MAIRRDLTTINASELRAAIVNMCKDLGISGSVANVYDLYATAENARRSAVQRRGEIEGAMRNEGRRSRFSGLEV